MKKLVTLVSVLSAISALAGLKPGSSNWVWFDAPCGLSTQDWEQRGLPVGNGRIGAMVMDGVAEARLALNEATMWTGGENKGGNCSGYGYGPKADRNQFGCYQPFGDFFVKFPGLEGANNFIRALDLSTGVAGATMTKNGVEYSREVFASTPAQVIAAIYKANKPKSVTAEFSLSPVHNAKVATKSISDTAAAISYQGKLANGLSFAATAIISAKGGKLTVKPGADVNVNYEGGGDGMKPARDTTIGAVKVEGVDAVKVVIAMNTDYAMSLAKNWKGEEPTGVANKTAFAALKAKNLKDESVKAHATLFNRCQINLGKTRDEVAKLPTPKRLEAYRQNANDPELEATLFQFGRYCLIGSSRGSLPANLQGLWNDKVHPAWACDYHTNINIQEAYWPAEVTNLSECHLPLFDWLDAIAPVSREITARQFKKKDGSPVRGWTTRVSQNPVGAGGWTMWNVPCNAWYALHYWEHYQFTLDKDFLAKRAYPMMKEACQFWEDMLKELGPGGQGFHSSDGKADKAQLKDLPAGVLVAPNGWSHEWGPTEDGVMHDQQLVRDLFSNTIKAASILGVDQDWAKALQKKRDRLAGNKIAKGGYLQEWILDRPNMVSGHRHTSHLFAVYPGSEISCAKTPDFAAAAKKSLELRGSSGDSRRSWSWPWRCALWARLRDGEKAHSMVEGLLKHNTLANMLTTHPPFQMDGNFAYPAAVSEMLLQSHAGMIELLPAPCQAWPNGKVMGMKARGNITVDFEWQNGKVTKYELVSDKPHSVKVSVNGKIETVKTKAK